MSEAGNERCKEAAGSRKAHCHNQRDAIEALKQRTVKHSRAAYGAMRDGCVCSYADNGEDVPNLILAYRALEDARMRFGKVIQALDGGLSKYDKEKKPDGDHPV